MLLTNAPLHFPEAREWMWDYCIYLGPFTSSADRHYDLGIHINKDIGGISMAVVYGDVPGNYISGPLKLLANASSDHNEMVRELIKRVTALKLIK